MKLIQLNKGRGGKSRVPNQVKRYAMVDDDMFETLNKHNWYYQRVLGNNVEYGGYPKTTINLENGKRKSVTMHRMVMGAKSGENVDHKDRNTLNNQKSNLRLCTLSENGRNQLSRNGASGYKGVHRDRKHWKCSFRLNYKMICLGYFKTPIEAAICYNENIRKYHGEFAVLNEIKEVIETQK